MREPEPKPESKPSIFMFRVTLGELLAVLSAIGCLISFTLTFDRRVTKLEVIQEYQGKAIAEALQMIARKP